MALTSFEAASARPNTKKFTPAYDILAMEHPGTKYLRNFVAEDELFMFAWLNEDVAIRRCYNTKR